jgi:hypothetical protein
MRKIIILFLKKKKLKKKNRGWPITPMAKMGWLKSPRSQPLAFGLEVGSVPFGLEVDSATSMNHSKRLTLYLFIIVIIIFYSLLGVTKPSPTPNCNG